MHLSNHVLCFLKCISLCFITVALTACVDLSGSHAINTHKYVKHVNKNTKSNTIVTQSKFTKGQLHTMRGGLGIFSIGMNQLRDSVDAQYHIPAYGTMWYNAGEVSQFIIKNYYTNKDRGPIILIGHSLGANEQIKVARNLYKAGIPVALLVTVDAVSQTIVPPNVHYALNVYKPGFLPMFSGLKLRAVTPKTTFIENVNVNTVRGINVNHFTIDKDRIVQAMILNRIEKALVDGNKHQR